MRYPDRPDAQSPGERHVLAQRSLPVLAQDLLEAGLDDVEVILEHALPLSSKRLDVLLAGSTPGRSRRRTSSWS